MVIFHFVRHGEPEFPGGIKLCLGRTELPLSDKGREQAKDAALRFSGRNLPVFCSPQIRAVETASFFETKPVIIEQLRERDMGAWDGLSFDEIRGKYPQLYAMRSTDKSLLPDGAESLEDIRTRFGSALKQIAVHCGGEAVVVTHSGVMEIFFDIPKPAYGSVTTVFWEIPD